MKNSALKPHARLIFLSGEIDSAAVGVVSATIVNINENDAHLAKVAALSDMTYTPKPIKLYIDSNGGDVYSMFGLVSIIQASKVPVHTIVTGAAMSAALIISVSGHRRFCHKSTTFMHHQTSSDIAGTLQEIKDNTDEMERIESLCDAIIAKTTKITKDKAAKKFKIKPDWYFGADEALKLGVVDEIIQ